MRTHFDPPGRPIEELAKLPADQQVLIASNTVVYGSGPSTTIDVGWWDGKRVKVSWNSHVMPLEDFQCWWPLPKVSYSYPKKRRVSK